MERNVEPSAIFFQAFNSVIRSYTCSSSRCFRFEAPTASNLSLMLNFYRTNVEPIDQVKSKATWAKSFLMLLVYRKQIIQNQRKTVRRAATINVHWRKSSCELFPLATTHTKVPNSGSGEMVMALYRMRYFFQKREALPVSLLEK